MKELKFSYTYDKLCLLNDGYHATTIRRRNKFKLNEKVKVIANGQFLCYAQIKKIRKIQIKELSDFELIDDVSPHADTREAALALINRFYRNPISEESVVFLYSLKRIPESAVIIKITNPGAAKINEK